MSEPHARAEDDKANLFDMHAVIEALEKAQDALRAAMVGQGPRQRENFIFQVGFARGRLSRISSRIYGVDPPPLPEENDGETDP